MIYTLTTNPSIDMYLKLNKKMESKIVNRSYETTYSSNGKGINLSLVLNHYGVKSKALGFFGGFSGTHMIEDLTQNGIDLIPVIVEDNTRINIFLNDTFNEFKISGEGSYVNKEKQKEMLEIIDNLEDIEYLCISGSLPKGIDVSYYDEILKICNKKNIEFILDISSSKLKDLLSYKPFLIKPNDEEIKDIFGIEIKNEEDIINVLKYLNEQGAKNILLTLGDKGLYFYNGSNIYFANAQKIKLLSSTCAGDSALAAFLSKLLYNNKNLEEALKFASATGANVAESSGIGDLKKVESYVQNIKTRIVM